MLRSLALGLALGIGSGPVDMEALLGGVRQGLLGTAGRLVEATLLVDPPPRAAREREHWVFRATQRGPYDPLINAAAATEGLDPFLLKGLLENESQLDPKLVGKRKYGVVGGRRRVISGGARGIAQLTSAGIDAVNELRQRRGAAPSFTTADAMRPERAIAAAAALLADFIDRFGRDGGITAYNTGPVGGRVVRELGFARAVRDPRLHRSGGFVNQGARFLPHVLLRTNRLRAACGLERLPGVLPAASRSRRPAS